MLRAMTRTFAGAAVLVLALCHPARGQYPAQPTVAIYADETGSQCNLVDDAPGVKEYYVVMSSPVRLVGVDFSAPKPDCFEATWLGDELVFPLALGNSQVGISIAFPSCWLMPVHVLTLRYFVAGTTPECCYFPVLPRPDLTAVEATDCSYQTVAGLGVSHPINAGPDCPCGGMGFDPPVNPSPPSGAYNQPVNVSLSWSAPEWDFGELTYDVYMGASTPLPLVASGPDTTFTPDLLQFGGWYLWRVVARDSLGNTSEGPIWNFWTKPVSSERLVMSSWDDHCEGVLGDTVGIDVTVENSLIDIDEGGFTLSYNPAVMEFAGWEPGVLIDLWDGFTCEDMGTYLQFAGTTAANPIPETASGLLARVKFLSLCCNATHETTVGLCPGAVTGDFRALFPVCGTYYCGADTIFVAADGSGDVATIQDAVDIAYNLDVVLLGNGTFTGPGNRDVNFNGRNTIVKSLSGNRDACIIDCEGSSGEPHRGFIFENGEDTLATLRGVTIINGYSDDEGAAIRIAGASPTIENCAIVNAADGGGGGGAIYIGPGTAGDYSAPHIRDCAIIEPQTSGVRIDDDADDGFPFDPVLDGVEVRLGTGHGIELGDDAWLGRLFLFGNDGVGIAATSSAPLTVRWSRIAGNREGGVHSQSAVTLVGSQVVANRGTGPVPAVIHSSGAPLTIRSSLLAFNSDDLFAAAGAVTMTCSDVFGNAAGDYVGPIAGLLGVSGNISADPLLANLEYQVASGSPCRAINNPCGVVIGSVTVGPARQYTVSSNEDHSGDFTTIQKAIDVSAGATGYLAQSLQLLDGTFTGPGNRDLDFLGRSLVIESQAGDAAAVVIDCQGAGRGVYFRGGEDSTAALRHVTIRNGAAGLGGGIRCESQPTIEHVVVEACSASAGGGIYYSGDRVNLTGVTVTGCVASDSAGGIYVASLVARGSVAGCTVENCTSGGPGGGIMTRNADVTGCTVGSAAAAGPGGGIYALGDVRDCVVYDCDAANGAGVYTTGDVSGGQVTGCTATADGGGVYAGDTAIFLCDVSGNTAGGNGGGVYLGNGTLYVCEIYGNAAAGDGGGAFAVGSCTVDSSHVFDNTAGGNGGGVHAGAFTVYRALFHGNGAANGGAIRGAGSIDRTTIADNSGTVHGGGVYATGPTSVHASIISGSASGDAVYCGSGSATVTCSDLYGNAGGDFTGCVAGQDTTGGNISLDPRYRNPASDDYALALDSPCLAENTDCGIEMGYTTSVIGASITVRPNYWSEGIYVSVEVSPPLLSEDIDRSSVRIIGNAGGAVQRLNDAYDVGDYDGNGIPELYMEFNRLQFQRAIPQGDNVSVRIEGRVGDALFAGHTTISYHFPVITDPEPYEIVEENSMYTVRWSNPTSFEHDEAIVFWNYGPVYYLYYGVIGVFSPDPGSCPWLTPNGYYNDCRIIVGWMKDGVEAGIGVSDPPFYIGGGLVATTLRSSSAVVEDGAAVVRWESAEEDGLAEFRVLRSANEAGGYTPAGDAVAPQGAGANYEFRDASLQPNQRVWYRIVAVDRGGAESILWTESVTYRLDFALEQNYPNPFNPTTTIVFSIPEPGRVSLVVYDITGRPVRTLVDERRDAGRHPVTWDGRDDHARRVASGIYFYRIVAGRHVQTHKMVLMK